MHRICPLRIDGSLLLRLVIAELHPAADGFGRGLAGNPVEGTRIGFRSKQLLPGSQSHRVALCRQGADVQRLPGADAQPPPLAHGVADDALVPAQHGAAAVDEIAGRGGEPGVPLDHGGIVPVRHEADVLTVRLGGVYKALRLCQLPHLLLPQPTQRKQGVGQLLLGHGVEHVALILACVQPLFQQIAPVLLFDPGVMPGGDILAAQNPGPLHQLFKFHISVAVDAGIGGDAGPVAFNKFVHHLFGKGILKVEHIVGHPQPVGHAPGVLHILQGAAAAPCRQAGLLVIV